MVDETKKIEENNIVLCLSGGGLRATFYHLGVLRGLRDLGLLQKVTHIYSVSGGSILAAHAVLNWSRYIGSEEEFSAATKEITAFGARDIRTRVINRWLAGLPLTFLSKLPFFKSLRVIDRYFGRSHTLEAEYRALVEDANLHQLKNPDVCPPKLYLLTTSFSSGKACAFTSDGFISDVRDPSGKLNRTGNVPVSRTIAASSAFPPLFPPVAITRDSLNATVEAMPDPVVFLTDGGVFDNLGLDVAELVHAFDVNTKLPHQFLVSDASAPFAHNGESNFSDLISRTVRTTDILMNRVTETAREAKVTSTKDQIIHLNIDKEIEGDTKAILPPDIQLGAARIRTDLDLFTKFEQDILMQRGYEVCLTILKRDGLSIAQQSDLGDLYDPKPLKKAIARLKKSQTRRVFRPIFSDKFFWVLLFYSFLIVGVPVGLVYQKFGFVLSELGQVADENATLQSKLDQQKNEIDVRENSRNIRLIAEKSLPEVTLEYRLDFSQFLRKNGVRYLEANNLLFLGGSRQTNPNDPASNSYPPKFAWSNILPAAKALDWLARIQNEQPHISSVYRNPAYNRKIGGSSKSQHQLFNAIDFSFSKGKPKDWAASLRQFRAEEPFRGGIGVYDTFVHVDGRGTDTDWDSGGQALGPSKFVIRPDTRIFLQFSGFHRSKMIELTTYLHKLGWNVPASDKGGERTTNAFDKLEVRYSKKTRIEVVDQLIEDIALGPVSLELNKVPTDLVQPGIVEIWISQ